MIIVHLPPVSSCSVLNCGKRLSFPKCCNLLLMEILQLLPSSCFLFFYVVNTFQHHNLYMIERLYLRCKWCCYCTIICPRTMLAYMRKMLLPYGSSRSVEDPGPWLQPWSKARETMEIHDKLYRYERCKRLDLVLILDQPGAQPIPGSTTCLSPVLFLL